VAEALRFVRSSVSLQDRAQNAWAGRCCLFKNSWNLNQLNEDHPELGLKCRCFRWSAVFEPIALWKIVCAEPRHPGPGGAPPRQDSLQRKVTTVPDIFGWCVPAVTGAVITCVFLTPSGNRPKCNEAAISPAARCPAQAPPTGWRLKEAEARPAVICNRRMAYRIHEPLF